MNWLISHFFQKQLKMAPSMLKINSGPKSLGLPGFKNGGIGPAISKVGSNFFVLIKKNSWEIKFYACMLYLANRNIFFVSCLHYLT